MPAQLAEGVDVAANGLIVVAAQRDVQILSPDGRSLAGFGDHWSPAGRLFLPLGAAVDAAGRIHVADSFGQKVVRYTPRAAAQRQGAPPLPPAAVPALALRRARVSKAGVVSLRVTCTEARCRGSLRLLRPGRARTAAARTLGSARIDVGAGATRTVRVRLPPAARRTLRRSGRLRVLARADVTGAAAVRRALVLRR